MRVALVSPYDLSVPGGVPEHVRNLGAHLGRVGEDVHVVAPASGPVSIPGVRFHAIAGAVAPVRCNGSIARIALTPLAGARAARAIRAIDADVVHVHEPVVPVVGPVAAWAARGAVVATFHAARDGSWVPGPAVRAALGLVARRIDQRIAVSTVAHATAATYVEGPIGIVPNGVDVAAFDTARPVPPAMADGRPTVLVLGRLDPRKGFPVLIDAFARDPELRARARLVVAGPHGRAEAARWEARCRSAGIADARFVTPVDEGGRAALLQHATVTCAPATGGESHGVVLLEAMAAGSPVVAAANDGYRQVVKDGANGLLVPPGDARALASALGSILGDAPRRARLAAGGGETARLHDWAAVVERIVAAYHDALEARRRRHPESPVARTGPRSWTQPVRP